MNDESLTRWLHNPLKTDHTIYYRRRDGVAVEHMLRPGSFDMARRHFHPEYEIYLLLHGRRQIYYENRAYLLEEGSLALIDSSRIHMTCPAEDDPNHYYERIILYLDREKVEEYDRLFPDLGMRDFFHRHDGVYLPSSVERKRMTDMLETVMRELSSEQDRSRIAIDLAILQFFVGFWRTSCRSAHQRDEAARTKKGKFGIAHGVSEYLSVHFCEEIPLEKLAEAFHVSGSYLSRSFKDAVGVGIREYVTVEDVSGAVENFFQLNKWMQFFDPKGRTDMPPTRVREITMRRCQVKCDTLYQVPDALRDCELGNFTFSDLNVEAAKLGNTAWTQGI